jgi:lysophospholipase L1-like esterase
MSYGCMAAVQMGWLCDLSTGPGTGYISGGRANRFVVNQYIGPSTSFAERIPKLAAVYAPDIVILDGGRNDLFAPRDAVFGAMSETIADARKAWPAATIVLIRPRFLGRPDNDLGFHDDFIARLVAEPAAQGIVVLDPVSRFTGTDTSSMLSHDGIHPNQQGELALSSALVDSLLDHGFALKT